MSGKHFNEFNMHGMGYGNCRMDRTVGRSDHPIFRHMMRLSWPILKLCWLLARGSASGCSGWCL